MYDWELSEEQMAALDALDESEQQVLVAGKNPSGVTKRGGSVTWGGSVIEWKQGDGLD